MSTTHETDALRERYGAPRPGRRRALIVGVVVLALVSGGWLVWAGLFHATPPVASELVGFEVIDDHTASAVVDVDLEDGVEARCVLQALAEDHTPVGDYAWAPTDGRNRVELRTERRATAVSLVGCTAPGQPRPR